MKKTSVATLFISVSVFSLLFWKYSFLLSVFFLIIGYLKHKIIPIRKEFLWYVLVSVGATLVEVILVNVAHAWKYVDSYNIFGVPIWMSLFWGVAATTMISLYEGLTEVRKHKD